MRYRPPYGEKHGYMGYMPGHVGQHEENSRCDNPPDGFSECQQENVAETESVSVLNTQVGGGHYVDMPIQPVDYIVKNEIPFREACVIKYVTRHRKKNGVEDIKKAIHFLRMIQEEYEREQ